MNESQSLVPLMYPPMTVRLRPAADTLERLAEVARGEAEADVVLTGGALVNVFTEEV